MKSTLPPSQSYIVVNTPAGVGIVVIAADPRDSNFAEIEDEVDDAYDMMLGNGVPSANIRYLHSDYGVTSNWRVTHDATTANLNVHYLGTFSHQYIFHYTG